MNPVPLLIVVIVLFLGILAMMAIVLRNIMKFLHNAREQKSQFESAKQDHLECQNRLVHLNLPKLVKKLDELSSVDSYMSTLESVARKLEFTSENMQKLVLNYSKKVDDMQEKVSFIGEKQKNHEQRITELEKHIRK